MIIGSRIGILDTQQTPPVLLGSTNVSQLVGNSTPLWLASSGRVSPTVTISTERSS